jgi:hypothetical protein
MTHDISILNKIVKREITFLDGSLQLNLQTMEVVSKVTWYLEKQTRASGGKNHLNVRGTFCAADVHVRKVYKVHQSVCFVTTWCSSPST